MRKCTRICLVFPPTLQLDLSPRQFCRALVLTRQAAVQMADLKMCVEKPAAMKRHCERVFVCFFSLSHIPNGFKARQPLDLVIKPPTNCNFFLKKSVTSFKTRKTESVYQIVRMLEVILNY